MRFLSILILAIYYSFAEGATLKEPMPVDFYYRNISGFHQNGESLWIGKNLIIVQILKEKKNYVYKVDLKEEKTASLLKKFIELGAHPELVKDIKLDRTDPVRVKFIVREGSKIHKFGFWDHHWDKQPKEIQDLKKSMDEIFELTNTMKPLVENDFKRDDLNFWPAEFIKL